MTTTVEIFCRECSGKVEMNYGDDKNMKMMALSLCFGCLFWHELWVIRDSKDVARINGKHYILGAEASLDDLPADERGMGGGQAIIQFEDGRRVVSTNLWFQGEIDQRWKLRLRDNAQFVRQR